MDGRIELNNIYADIDVIAADNEIFCIAHFNENVDCDTAKDVILLNESEIRKLAFQYARDDEEKKIVETSTISVIHDKDNKYYIEFDDFH